MNEYLFVSGNNNPLTKDTIRNLIRLAVEDTPKIVFFFGCQENSLSSLKKNTEVLLSIMTKFTDHGSQVIFINGNEHYPFYSLNYLQSANNQIKCLNYVDIIECKSEIFVVYPIQPAIYSPEITIENKNKKVILISSVPITGPMNFDEKQNSKNMQKVFEKLNPYFAIQNITSNPETTTELKKYTFNNKTIYVPATGGSFIEYSIF